LKWLENKFEVFVRSIVRPLCNFEFLLAPLCILVSSHNHYSIGTIKKK
jgi:hypothetical protein